jgi:hypothetical protein
MAKRNQNSPRPLLPGEEPSHGSGSMNRKHAILLAILMLALPLFTLAQDQDDKGREWGGYTVRQSIELGGHIADSEGSQQMYFTFVNLASGPRLLSQELSMQSNNHAGVLFDNLYMSSFGFGGDPENMARLRISKNKWYNFVALYRRDKNFFDYNLFANPLQANAGANVYVPFINNTTYTGAGTVNVNYNPQAVPWFTNSPHTQALTRNMGDFSLTLLPESVVSFRLGYARNATYGFLQTTVSTSAGQAEDDQWKSDRYQIGADIKLLPRTTISADFFFEHDKNDLGFADNNRLFTLQGTNIPVDIGLTFFPFNASATSGSTSCTTQPIIPSAGVFVLNSNCTGALLQYLKRGNVRTDIPTGQLSLASNYFRNLDVTASAVYSSSSSDFKNFQEFNYGLSPTLLTGPANNDRVTANADLGLTYHLSKTLSISDKFRWVNWRQPGNLTTTQFTCSHLAAGATLLSAFLNPCSQATALLALIQATNAGATVAGNATTGTFEQITTYGTLIGERSYFNTAKLNWRPGRRFSAYAGYRYARRELKSGEGRTFDGHLLNPPPNVFLQNTTTILNVCQLNPAAVVGGIPCSTSTLPVLSTAPGVDTEKINSHTALLGAVVRPIEAWRINADLELLYADNAFTNISPRHQQRARVYSTYKANRWLNVNGGMHFVETRNDFAPSDTYTNTSPLIPTVSPLFPATGALIPFYGHQDHWRYYTLGMSLTPKSKFTFDIGWTLLDQDIKSATCMPLPTIAFGVASPLGTPTALNCANSPVIGGGTTWNTGFARALLLAYQETTNSGYANITFQPVKHVTLNAGYEITGDNGRTNWLRADNGQLLTVVADSFGNTPYIAANLLGCPAGTPTVAVTGGTACSFPGPFADQPLGPQAINWHKAHFGIAFDVAKGVQFKGLWNYYDYNSKDEVPALARLNVTAPRDFHANVGTLSLKYTF